MFLAVCPADSVCRNMLHNMKQFNGESGCAWFLTIGKSGKTCNADVRVYHYNDVLSDKRTHHFSVKEATKALKKGIIKHGIKGPSPLMNVEGFDVVYGFPPDCLHAVFLGVSRQLTRLWIDTRYHQNPFYIGGHLPLIDARLIEIQPTSEITRLPRSLTQQAYWKGSEWRAWLLFYSLVVLKDILPTQYLKHLMLLVDAVFRLSKDVVDGADLEIAHASLTKFVILFEDLYGQNHLTFNVHQLLHLAPAVKNWGPLWAFSSVWYEGNIGFLNKLFNGTQAVPRQIARSFQILKGIQAATAHIIRDDRIDVPSDVQDFLNRLLHGHISIKKCTSIGDTHMIGTHIVRKLTVQEKYAVETKLGLVVDVGKFYKKAIFNNTMFQTKLYRETRRVNYIVSLENGEVAEIENLAIVSDATLIEKPVAFVRFLELSPNCIAGKDVDSGACANHVRYISNVDDMLRTITMDEITNKCILVKKSDTIDGNIISALPNNVERD